ncbi:MAG: organomercurial lyase [Thermodesulfobacteriota bacterium]|nr:organomercurial lyase [Thermodesulfobacteriota bacterium]
MPKYSDTTLLHASKFSDTTKQIKRIIYSSILDTGFAPKVADIAQKLNISEEVTRASLHDLEGGIIIAMQNEQHADIKEFMGQKLPDDCVLPEVGEIYYARPFANFKNHHHIIVDGEQKWYGECPIECSTISYFFPGKEVVIRSVSHYTNEPIEIISKDGQLLDYTPKGLSIHWGRPFGQWLGTKGHETDFIFPCDQNYFFSTRDAHEEWEKSNPKEAGQGQLFHIIEINHLLRMFNYGHERFDFQYHLPLIRFALAAISTGVTRIKMFTPIPNLFFLSIVKLVRDVHKYGYKLFLDVKPW